MTDADTLSLNQEFLRVFDRGYAAGAFGHRHVLVYGWRCVGAVETGALRGALADVVARHEALRTSVERVDGDWRQVVRQPGAVELTVRELPAVAGQDRESAAEQLLIDVETGTYDVRVLPHLRAVLGRFDHEDAVLVLIAHHSVTDALSMQVIIQDLLACYAARTGHGPPPDRVLAQYRDFTRWQLSTPEDPQRLEYWRDQLGGLRFSAIETDRSGGTAGTYAAYRYLTDPELASLLVRLAKSQRCTPFIVSLAAYCVLLYRRTGSADVVAATTSGGRFDERFADTVGPFYNLLPLRVNLATARTFREALGVTRATCLGAYANDVPYRRIAAEVPALDKSFADPGRAVVTFENLQPPEPMNGAAIAGLRIAELRRRTRAQRITAAVPDGVLWVTEQLPSGEIAGTVKYRPDQFDDATITGLVDEYNSLLRAVVADPDGPVG